MAASMQHMTHENGSVNFSMRSGASLITVKPVFSHDNKYLFVGSADVIKVYSTVSGECLRELVGHEGQVTGILLHPKNRLQMLSCSEDKSVILWDYNDGIQLKSYLVGKPALGIFCCGLEDKVFLLVNRKGKTEGFDSELIEQSLSNKGVKSREILNACSSDLHHIAVGPKGHYCAAVLNIKLKVRDLQGKKPHTVEHTVESNHTFTCVTSHPNGNCLATGSCDGTIFLWFKFFTKNAVKSKLHWHSLPVKEVTYTPEGSYILSGGHECVLVKWHQHTEYRDFLPRLGAPINHIVCSEDNQYYAICQEDNVIQVVSSSFVIQQVYQGLTHSHNSTIPTGLRCDPHTQALVLNGKPGHIQFYSVHEDKQLFNLDIVGQNYISAESLDKPLSYTEITHVEFDDKGRWLSTAEYWNDGQMSPEIRLKFWVFNEESQSYTLNTTAEQAHSDKIGALKFRPMSESPIDEIGPINMVVTTSVDGKFKLWTLTDDSDIYRENVKWTCQSVGFYRDMPAGETAFSEDGTLLAVVFDSCITLWDPDTNLLRETLISSTHQSKINHVIFGNHNCSQYLVTSTDETVTVWNLINCSISWSADYSVVSITKDPATDFMAAFSKDRQLCIFRPSDPEPIFINKDVCNSPVLSSVFIPHSNIDLYKDTQLHWQCQSELYFMDKSQMLFSISLKGKEKVPKSKDDLISIEGNLPQSALSLLMKGHTNKSALRVDQKFVTLKPQDKYLKEILSSPAHVQPSVSTLCQSFIKSLLVPLPKTGNKEHGDDENDDDLDDDMMQEESQTVSMDSGLDSDSDMDSKVNQSKDIKTQSKSAVEKQSTKQAGEKIEKQDKKQSADLSGQTDAKEDIDLVTSVFVKSLSWYTNSYEVS